jgi:hypothetical protein
MEDQPVAQAQLNASINDPRPACGFLWIRRTNGVVTKKSHRELSAKNRTRWQHQIGSVPDDLYRPRCFKSVVGGLPDSTNCLTSVC